MKNEIKQKLEEIVTLLNDPEETVLEQEIKQKLEKILLLLDNPQADRSSDALKQKLDKIGELVNNAMVDPDIDIEYHPAEQEDEPYVLVTYMVGDYNKPTRKIRLGKSVLEASAEEIANQVTSSITEFKSEIDSVEMG